jgi:hypothetical protein
VQIVHVSEFMEVTRLRRVGAGDIADMLTADFAAFLYENPGARRVWMEINQDATRYRSLLVPGSEMINSTFAETVKKHLRKLEQLKHWSWRLMFFALSDSVDSMIAGCSKVVLQLLSGDGITLDTLTSPPKLGSCLSARAGWAVIM